MNTRPSSYRSTLVAAALTVACFGAVPAASAHEHGDRDGDRRGFESRHGWHERAERRPWGYYRPAPVFRPYYRAPVRSYDYDRAYVVPEAYYPPVYDVPPPVAYRPAPRADLVLGAPNVSLMIHVPL